MISGNDGLGAFGAHIFNCVEGNTIGKGLTASIVDADPWPWVCTEKGDLTVDASIPKVVSLDVAQYRSGCQNSRAQT